MIINDVFLNSDQDMVIHASRKGRFEPETTDYILEHFPIGGVLIDVSV
jgi:hypothetical protein